MTRQTPEEFAELLFRGSGGIPAMTKKIAARDAEIAEEARREERDRLISQLPALALAAGVRP